MGYWPWYFVPFILWLLFVSAAHPLHNASKREKVFWFFGHVYACIAAIACLVVGIRGIAYHESLARAEQAAQVEMANDPDVMQEVLEERIQRQQEFHAEIEALRRQIEEMRAEREAREADQP
jgi:hypothetical protein